MKYVKTDENKKVIETAPKTKGSITNYNIEANEEMLFADGYTKEETEYAYNGVEYVKGFAPAQPIENAKANKLAEINSDYQTRANAVRVGVPEDEVLTWDIQKLEAQAWEKDNTVATPFCDVLATSRGMDRVVLIGKVLEKVYAYQNYIGALTGKRQGYEDSIISATTNAEVEAIVWQD